MCQISAIASTVEIIFRRKRDVIHRDGLSIDHSRPMLALEDFQGRNLTVTNDDIV